MSSPASPITFGEQLRRAEVGDFILTETRHAPLLILPRHDHEGANINFVLSGSLRETIGRRPQECRPRSALIKPAGASHSDKYGPEGACCLIIEVKPHRLESISRFSKLFDEAAHLRGGALAYTAARIHRELRLADGASSLIVEGLILEMLGQAARRSAGAGSATTARQRWLERARDRLHERFNEKIVLAELASSVGVHPAHLAKIFRKRYGCSVGEYVRRLRLDYAAQELIRSDKPLAEIALAAGFFDQSHFTHTFRAQMKTTPAEFRASFKSGNADTKGLRFSKTR